MLRLLGVEKLGQPAGSVRDQHCCSFLPYPGGPGVAGRSAWWVTGGLGSSQDSAPAKHPWYYVGPGAGLLEFLLAPKL